MVHLFRKMGVGPYSSMLSINKWTIFSKIQTKFRITPCVKYMYFGQNWTELLQNELNYFHWILGFQVKYNAISLKVSCVIIMKTCIYLFMFKKYCTINKEMRAFTSYLLDLLMLLSKWTNFSYQLVQISLKHKWTSPYK